MIDNLKDLSLQMDDFEMIKPLAKGQFGTVSIGLGRATNTHTWKIKLFELV